MKLNPLLAILLVTSSFSQAATHSMKVWLPGLRVSGSENSPVEVVPAVPPSVSISTTSGAPLSAIAFESVALGSTSSTQTVSLKNTGTTKITFGTKGIFVAAPFNVVNSTCQQELAVGQSCQVSLTFSPQAENDYSTPLTVDYGPDTISVVPVTGYGTTSAVSVVSVAPPSTAPVVGSLSRFTVTFRNSSSTAITINGVTSLNPGGHKWEPRSTTIPANGTSTLIVDVVPGASGYFEPVLAFQNRSSQPSVTYAKLPLRFSATSTYAYSAMEGFYGIPVEQINRLNYTVPTTGYMSGTLSNRYNANPLAATVFTVPATAVNPKLEMRAMGRDGSTLRVVEGSISGPTKFSYSFGTYTGAIDKFTTTNLSPGQTYYVIPQDKSSYSTSLYSALLLWN